jgi:AraC-like DNA-binding protein
MLVQISLCRSPCMSRRHAPGVATELGYASQTAFAAAFRKLTGETPSDWRRRMH